MVSSCVEVFERLALRHGTQKTYAGFLRHFERFCSDTGRVPRGPISEERLCEAAIYFCSQRSVNQLGSYMSALSWWHKVSGCGELPRRDRFNRCRQGLRNVYGQFDKVEPAFAISLTQLYHFQHKLNMLSFENARNWCAALFGFFGLLRVGEYCAASPQAVHLRVKHVTVTKEGIRLIVPFSKTSLTPTPVHICRRDDIMCPVQAYDYYLSFFSRTRDPEEPFFVTTPSPTSARASLTPDTFIK